MGNCCSVKDGESTVEELPGALRLQTTVVLGNVGSAHFAVESTHTEATVLQSYSASMSQEGSKSISPTVIMHRNPLKLALLRAYHAAHELPLTSCERETSSTLCESWASAESTAQVETLDLATFGAQRLTASDMDAELAQSSLSHAGYFPHDAKWTMPEEEEKPTGAAQ